ncbi:MAG: galactosyltransferase-related protein [Chthoniobacterales bacterium]
MKPDPFVTAILISAGRPHHLHHTLEGLSRGTRIPDEVIVVNMDQPTERTSSPTLSTRHLDCRAPADHPLPLARARNLGAAEATPGHLLFLDVDCIPAADYVKTVTAQLASTGGLIMGTPRYLRAPVGGHPTDADLERGSDPHELQPRPATPTEKSDHYHLFWSLCFGIQSTDFTEIGGFDASFVGYGGEDTDFAYSARSRGVRFHRSQATVFHQPHPSQSPPLQHFDSIIINANRFRKKWGVWPMEGWLSEFRERGLIEWSERSPDPIQIRHLPPEPG